MIDKDVGKSHKNAIEEKIIGYYVDGKLSEDHRQLLKDKISEYYGSVKGSESDAWTRIILYIPHTYFFGDVYYTDQL